MTPAGSLFRRESGSLLERCKHAGSLTSPASISTSCRQRSRSLSKNRRPQLKPRNRDHTDYARQPKPIPRAAAGGEETGRVAGISSALTLDEHPRGGPSSGRRNAGLRLLSSNDRFAFPWRILKEKASDLRRSSRPDCSNPNSKYRCPHDRQWLFTRRGEGELPPRAPPTRQGTTGRGEFQMIQRGEFRMMFDNS